MAMYKINSISASYDPNPANGHSGVPKASSYSGNGCWDYYCTESASTTTWKYTNLGDGKHSMEYVIGHFSGGGGGASTHTGSGNGTPTPIELLSFNAFADGEINKIIWKTAAEVNVDKFIVERLNPNDSTITEVGTLKATGYSNVVRMYSLDDVNPLPEGYYRLRNIDFDGAQEAFGWVFVKRSEKNLSVICLYPNPVHGTLHIEVVSNYSTLHIELRDIVGKVIKSFDYSNIESYQKIDLDLFELSSGTYYLSVNTKKQRVVKMIIVD